MLEREWVKEPDHIEALSALENSTVINRPTLEVPSCYTCGAEENHSVNDDEYVNIQNYEGVDYCDRHYWQAMEDD